MQGLTSMNLMGSNASYERAKFVANKFHDFCIKYPQVMTFLNDINQRKLNDPQFNELSGQIDEFLAS